MSGKKSKKRNNEDFRSGMILVRAWENNHSVTWNDGYSPEADAETRIGNISKSPLLGKLFKKALKDRDYFSNFKIEHDQSMHVGVMINQMEFDSIMKVIGHIGLGRSARYQDDFLRKTVLYKGHFYEIYLSIRELDMPDTWEQDNQTRKKVFREWHKRVKEDDLIWKPCEKE